LFGAERQKVSGKLAHGLVTLVGLLFERARDHGLKALRDVCAPRRQRRDRLSQDLGDQLRQGIPRER
jgi:hypothetical protein